MCLLFFLLTLTSCVAQKPLVKSEMTPEQKDKAECEFEKSKATGYDYIEVGLNRGNIYRACMKAKGYK